MEHLIKNKPLKFAIGGVLSLVALSVSIALATLIVKGLVNYVVFIWNVF